MFYRSDCIIECLVNNHVYEKKLSYSGRKGLSDEEFGLPDKRKYPMPDRDHVLYAIRFFNDCGTEDEKELADNIKFFAKKYNLNLANVNVGSGNRFSKYLTGKRVVLSDFKVGGIFLADDVKYLLESRDSWVSYAKGHFTSKQKKFLFSVGAAKDDIPDDGYIEVNWSKVPKE